MYTQAQAAFVERELDEAHGAVPSVFCWTKMGSETGQPLRDIVARKELERQCGGGVFAWGIGNSVGPAVRHARSCEHIAELDTLFTPMKSAAKAIDTSPTTVLLWRAFEDEDGALRALPDHMMITSRGHSEAGDDKRSHFALICRSNRSLLSQAGEMSIDHRAVRNLVSTNPVGASQVTSVVRYLKGESTCATYPVLFRAKLVDAAFVRLALPITLTGATYSQYREVCASTSATEWRVRLHALKSSHPMSDGVSQAALF